LGKGIAGSIVSYPSSVILKTLSINQSVNDNDFDGDSARKKCAASGRRQETYPRQNMKLAVVSQRIRAPTARARHAKSTGRRMSSDRELEVTEKETVAGTSGRAEP
jgi:hypothetical protein